MDSRKILTALAAVLLAANAFAADRSPAEKSNLDLVMNFWNNVFMKRDTTRVGEFFAPDYVDHNPNVTAPGIPGLIDYLKFLASRPAPAQSDVVVATVDGEIVTLIRKRMLPNTKDPGKTYEAFGFDAMRVHGGKIVEHWDAATLPSGAPK
jgi:predicted SnoaL-like aldol condensation-catalyzing enzyme